MKALSVLVAATFLLAVPCCSVMFADTKDSKTAGKSEPAFYPLPNGQAGLMDKKMKDFLESKADNPSQQKLDAMLQCVDRIVVEEGDREEKFSTRDAEKINQFKKSLKIVEDPKTFGHCMCFGNPQIYLYSGKKQIAHLSCQHGIAIRWNDGWKWDADLKDGSLLTEWLAANGASQLKKDVADDQKRSEERKQHLNMWLTAMPACLKPYTKEVLGDGPGWNVFVPAGGQAGRQTSESPIRGKPPSKFWKYWQALELNYRDKDSQILALLTWFGSGAGPWSGFPSYEELPEKMLLEVDTKDIIHAVKGKRLSAAQLEGTARYFAGWGFRSKKELSLVPGALQKELLAHTEKSADKDNIERARAAFNGN